MRFSSRHTVGHSLPSGRVQRRLTTWPGQRRGSGLGPQGSRRPPAFPGSRFSSGPGPLPSAWRCQGWLVGPRPGRGRLPAGKGSESSDGTCPLSAGGLRVPGRPEQLPGAHGAASGRTPATMCQQLPMCGPGSPVRSPAERLCQRALSPGRGRGLGRWRPPWCSGVVLVPQCQEGREAPRRARPQQVRGRGGPVAGRRLLPPSLDPTSKLPCAPKLDARLLRLPACPCVPHIQQVPTVCRTGAAPGRLLRAGLAVRMQVPQACPALQPGPWGGCGHLLGALGAHL